MKAHHIKPQSRTRPGLLLFVLGLALLGMTHVFAATYTASQSGDWSANATWGGSGHPVAGDTANIYGAYTVTVSTPAACAAFNLQTSASARLVVQSGQTLTLTGNFYASSGAMTNDGTLTVGGSVTVAGSVTLVNNGTMSVTGNTTMTSGNFYNNNTLTLNSMSGTGATLVQGATAWLNLNGWLSAVFPLAATATGNTVSYARTSGQNVTPTNYYHLIFGGGNTKTLLGTTTVTGNLTINSSTTLDVSTSGYPLSVGGSLTNSGTMNVRTNPVTVSGVLTLNAGGTVKMNLDTVNGNNGKISGMTGVNYDGTLTVANLNNQQSGGEVYQLFNTPNYNGLFATVTLPTLSNTNLAWTNKLAINGTIGVVSTSGLGVTLTNPVSGDGFTSPATIQLQATTSSTSSTVTNVAFYAGASKLADATTAPYSYNWTGVPAGIYALTAVVSDDAGGTFTSLPVNVTVTNVLPSVSLTNPVAGATFGWPAHILLEATASDSNGTVTNVAFYTGATKLADDSSAPYSYNWTSASAGGYALKAVATDNEGGSRTSSVVNITVTNTISVALTNPVNGATFNMLSSILLQATASDSAGVITNVAFYAGGTKLGDDPSAPYSYNWPSVPAGNYTLTAVAMNNQGASSTSAGVAVTVNDTNTQYQGAKWHPLDLSFTSTNTYSNPFTNVSLSAFFTGPGGRTFTVPGFYTKSNRWVIRFSPTAEGMWSFLTSSTDSQLSNKDGTITCLANANTNVHGAIQIDPAYPRHFKYEDGTQYFMLGYESDWMAMMDFGDTNVTKTRTLIDMIVSNGFNEVTMALYANDTPWRSGNTTTDGTDPQGKSFDFGPPAEYPWEYSGAQTPASSKFNQAYWENLDRVMAYLHQKGVTAHLYLRMQGNKYSGSQFVSYQSAQESLLIKYTTARYQAYPNVIWDYQKEINSATTIAIMSERLQFIKNADGYKRLRTIHDADPWSQSAAANTNADFYTDQNHPDQNGGMYAAIMSQRGYLPYPILNAEYGYQVGNNGGITYNGGTPSAGELLQRTCEIYMAGGYPAYYYTYHGWDVIKWNETPNGLNHFLNLANFFKSTKWYTLSPDDSLIGGGSVGKHCLANPGTEYIVYLQNGIGSVTLTISGAASDTPLTAKWVDLNSGVAQTMANVGNGTTTFTKPSNMSSSPAMLYVAPPAVPPVAAVQVETAADGSGTVVPAQNITAGNAITLYAIARDGGGVFLSNTPAIWTLTGMAGGVVDGDLVSAGNGMSAVFTGHLTGSAKVRVSANAINLVDSGTLTVVTGPASQVRVETAANGGGTVVPAQSFAIPPGGTVAGYAITRDVGGNFIANVAANAWSLENITGSIVGSDLVVAGDSKSATFSTLHTGTADLRATSAAFLSSPVAITVVSNTGAFAVVGLAWTTQPAGAVSGAAFTTQPVLKTVDQYGYPSTVGLPASMLVTISGSVPLIAGATTTYDIGTAHGNGSITGVGLGFQGGVSGSQNLTAAAAPIYGVPPVGMAIWLDANVPSSVTTNGSGQVTAWADQSGNNNHFNTVLTAPNGAGNGITYTNTVPNGRRTVTFGSMNPTNGQALYNSTYNNSGTSISVFLVTKQNGGPAWQKTLSATDGTRAADKNTCFDFNHYNDNLHPGVERQWDNHIAVNLDPAAEYHAEEFICNSSGNNYWYAIASATTAGTVLGTMSTANLTINQFSVGGGLGTGTTLEDPIQGDICELLVYSSDQSANRTAIETYLKNKWMKSITAISAGVVVAPAAGPSLSLTRTGNTLNFTWTGAYKLQSQTNSLSTGISTNWSDHPGGGSSPVSVTIAPGNPTMFFRLISQ